MTGPSTSEQVSCGQDVNFLCGVVEGFYGRPWTSDQRKLLFKWMCKLGMNMYTYAPKDDFKHRMYWRELYSIEEADNLISLIESSREMDIQFVYAISPGLDMTYSSAKDVTFLKRKLEQVASFGCKAFALLFDDIDVELCEADKNTYQSSAHAHVSITNEIYQHLNQPTFLFCPTEYCAARAIPCVADSLYLTTVGSKLLPSVQVMWTGPKVVSRRLTIESLDEIAKVLKRPPLIWDNIHANDYDPKRLFLGPYEGRSPSIIPYITGVLTNPNCEFEANFIALHTLAQWKHSNKDGVKKDNIPVDAINPVITDIKLEKDEIEEVVEPESANILSDDESTDQEETIPAYDERYEPRVALKTALGEWVSEFYVGRQPLQVPLSPPIPSDASLNTLTTELSVSTIKTCLVVTQPTVLQTQACTITPTTTSSVLQPVPSVIIQENTEDVDMQLECTPVVSAGDVTERHPSPSKTSIQSTGEVPALNAESNQEDLEPMDLVPDESLPQSASRTSPNAKTTKHLDSEMQIDMEVTDLSKPSSSFAKNIYDQYRDSLKPSDLPAHLNTEDLELLVDLFYMPFEHGSTGIKMLNLFYWLKIHSHFMHRSKDHTYTEDEINEWKQKSETFSNFVNSVSQLTEKLTKIPNRALLYDLFPYVWDIKGILTACDGYNKWLERGLVTQSNSSLLSSSYFWFSKNYKHSFASGVQEPWMFRGGLQAEFHRLLPVEGAHDLFMIRPPDLVEIQPFCIRPYQLSDEPKIYDICSHCYYSSHPQSVDAFKDWPELLGDRLVGGVTALSYEYCFVVEDSSGIIGYCICVLDTKLFHQKYVNAWLPAMTNKYPKPEVLADDSHPAQKMMNFFHLPPSPPSEFIHRQHPSVIDINFFPSVTLDRSIPKRLLICALSALRTSRSGGVHCVVEENDTGRFDFYCKLGFFQISHIDECGDSRYIPMGRLI